MILAIHKELTYILYALQDWKDYSDIAGMKCISVSSGFEG